MGKDVSQKVAYQSVLEHVQAQWDSAAEDPDLPELFDFLISAGVGQNSHAQDFRSFAACFVDCKQMAIVFLCICSRDQHPRAGSSDEDRRHEEGLQVTAKSWLLSYARRWVGGICTANVRNFGGIVAFLSWNLQGLLGQTLPAVSD